MVRHKYYKQFIEECIIAAEDKEICIWGARRTGKNLFRTLIESNSDYKDKIHIIDRDIYDDKIDGFTIEKTDNYLNNNNYMIICAAESIDTAYKMGEIIIGNTILQDYYEITENYANFLLYLEKIKKSSTKLISEERLEYENLIATLYSHQNYVSDLIVDGEYKNVAPITTKIGCPINCKYCPQDTFVKAYSKRDNPVMELSLENFKKMLENIPKHVIVSFTGFVEPFANKRCIDMIMYALDEGYIVRVFTTLYNVSIEDYMKFKDHENLKTIDIHLPDSNYNTQFDITEDYLKTLKYVVDNPPKYARFWTSCLGVTSRTRDEIKDIISVHGNPINSIHGLVYDNNLSHKGAKLKCNRDCSRIDNEKAGVGMILPNGEIFACTQDWELQNYIGNIFEDKTWDEVMQGNLRNEFRDALNNPRIDNICTYCELAIEVDQGDKI
ncbi:MAG: radical SAM protein [Lachnospirales bacterium]